MSDNAIQISDSVHPIDTGNRLIELAVTHNADVDKLAKLMELQERWHGQQADRAFRAAMAEFQSICPPITKNKAVEYKSTKYTHATLDHIAETVRRPLAKCGLSYRWEIEDKEFIRVVFIVSHVDGHSERTSMEAMPDDSGAKNLIQQRGSTVTYLQRYTMIGGLGLTSANEDDDGKSSGSLNVERLIDAQAVVRDNWRTVSDIKAGLADGGDISSAAEAYAELSYPTLRAMWIAPSKGGIFTTAERKAMDSEEFQGIAHQYRKDAGWYERPENQQ